MRVRTAVSTKNRKHKYFKIAKGYYSNKRNRWRQVQQAVHKSLEYAYTGRKDKKHDFRSLWITRINALCNELGISYSKFMHGLKKAGVSINRKMLSEMAIHDKTSFQQLVELSKSALA
jgi:large subunit ribosomal protein L20